MKSTLAFALATCGLMVATANGQTLRQPNVFRNVAYSDYYVQPEVEPSPSDLRVADAPPAPLVAQPGGKDGAKGGSCGAACDCLVCCDEPWRLFPVVGCGWQLTGWVDLGATANADNPASQFNGPVTFNDRERFQANQVYLTFGRDVDTGGCGWDWGGRVDFLYGTDYIFTQSAGLETHDDFSRHWNRSGNQYGIAMPQLYGEIGYNNVRLKLGHFYTIIGYEAVTAPDNFFYSHSYTMQYGEPFTHTGGLASWDYSDQLTLHAGLVNGWDKFDAETDRTSLIGGASYTPCHERYSVAFAFITGEEDGSNPPVVGTRTMYSLVFSYQITDSLNYVVQHDNGWQEVGAGADEEWYGINQYLLYTINDCWKAGARFEWFRDDDGARLSGFPLRTGGAGVAPQAAFAGDYYNATVGLNWTPTANLTVRPELRWDWSDDTVVAPYDDFTKDSQFLAAFDLIYQF